MAQSGHIIEMKLNQTLSKTAGYLPFTTDIIAYHDVPTLFNTPGDIKQYFKNSVKFNFKSINGKKVNILALLQTCLYWSKNVNP